ncbi:MAG: GTPase Era [Clostridiales bacterium]|nr:MAG: GTPase Era [Clostridiales bacterium]
MKTAFITVCGRANVGKSTLMNALIGEKVSIISDKPQTTRNKITGIYNAPDVQLVFIDTPGVLVPKNKLGEHMLKEVNEALDEVDIILLVAECRKPGMQEHNLLERFKGQTVILVLNKVDKVPKKDVAEAIMAYSQIFDFRSIIPTSALRNDGVKIVLDELLALAEEGPAYYPEDTYTSQTVRQMVSEIVREKILRNMYDEIPHGIAVEPIIFKERENKNGEPVTDVIMNIICERETHKGMIIGKNGQMLKKMASQARQDMEKLLDTKVYLECHVKVKENWRDSEKLITELGLYDE